MLVGAHVSISGGLNQAPLRGEAIGCTAIQVFTKNQLQWKAKPLSSRKIKQYRHSLANSSIMKKFKKKLNILKSQEKIWRIKILIW
jgi:deoxyribonuclease-4